MASQTGGQMAKVVGENLRRYADEQRLSQRQIADALGVTPSQVSHWFAGTHEPRKHLIALAALLTGGDVSALYRIPEPLTGEAA